MQVNKSYIVMLISVVIAITYLAGAVQAAPQWYEYYQQGLKAMDNSNWEVARNNFESALKFKNIDSKKQRVGTMFINYYPNRELGVAYFNLGDYTRAMNHLKMSYAQCPTTRAQEYINLIDRAQPNLQYPPQQKTNDTPTISEVVPATPVYTPAPVPEECKPLIGDRMRLAVLPFETRGIGEDLGEMNLFDKMITAFVDLGRFVVIERSQLERILEEHKLGLSGVIDASTAVEVGKMAGVDAVVFGSIASDKRTVTIDARLVDTETAEIISSRDAFSKNLSLINLSEMIVDVARKIKNDFPIVDGILINADTHNMMIDLGSSRGIKKGMKCYVYREGLPVIHPITGDTLDVKKDILCEMQVTDVFDNYSEGKAIKIEEGTPKIGDKVQTK